MSKKYLYIVLTRPQTVLSKLIRLIKNDSYTHAAVSLDGELTQMYSFGRKAFYNPFIGGFVQERLDQGLYKLHKVLPGVILEMEVSKEQYDKAKGLVNDFIAKRNAYQYNYLGLLFSLFQKESCGDSRFLCSEFVYYVFRESGVVDFNLPGNLVRPQNLLDLKATIIYEGNLKNYNFKAKKSRKGRWKFIRKAPVWLIDFVG